MEVFIDERQVEGVTAAFGAPYAGLTIDAELLDADLCTPTEYEKLAPALTGSVVRVDAAKCSLAHQAAAAATAKAVAVRTRLNNIE